MGQALSYCTRFCSGYENEDVDFSQKIARLEISCTLATMNTMILQTRLKFFQSHVAGRNSFQKQDLQDLEDLIDELKKLRAEVGQYQNC